MNPDRVVGNLQNLICPIIIMQEQLIVNSIQHVIFKNCCIRGQRVCSRQSIFINLIISVVNMFNSSVLPECWSQSKHTEMVGIIYSTVLKLHQIFTFWYKMKGRLIIAESLSSQLRDLLLHICKNVDKSSAVQKIKLVFGLLLLNHYDVLLLYFPHHHPSHPLYYEMEGTHSLKPSSAACFCYFNHIHSLQAFTQIFIFRQAVLHMQHRGAALQPLSTTADPELLHWDRPRLSSLLKGFSLVVNVRAESRSFSLP